MKGTAGEEAKWTLHAPLQVGVQLWTGAGILVAGPEFCFCTKGGRVGTMDLGSPGRGVWRGSRPPN